MPADEIVKAYEVADGEHVYLTDEDFRAAEEEGYRTIEVLDFVPHDEIDPIVFQRTYYLGPAEGAEKVYALLAQGDGGGRAVGCRAVRLPRPPATRSAPRSGRRHHAREHVLRRRDTADGRHRPGRRPRVDKRELEMAATLIERFTTSFDHSRYEDEYRARLLTVIERKRKGDDVHAAPQEEREAPSDLLAAFRESVEAAKGTSRAKNARAAKPKRRASSGTSKRPRS